MFGLPVSLIVYSVIALVIGGSIFGLVRSHDNKIRTAEAAKWKPQLEAAVANEQIAKDANVTLQASLQKLSDERKACSDSVAAYEHETAAAMAQRASAEARAKAARSALEQDRDMAVRWAITPRPAGQTCEQTLTVMDTRLRALAIREYAERPPVDPTGKVDVKVGK